ncbi:hypothetical protein HBB16_14355 [Pseudonocardia sp. MCCB 268]|nr:hypothetical protein [Pseudonocardia cytotoxica]
MRTSSTRRSSSRRSSRSRSGGAGPDLEEGSRTVVDPGRAGERSVIWRVTYDKGREVARERIAAGQDTLPSRAS